MANAKRAAGAVLESLSIRDNFCGHEGLPDSLYEDLLVITHFPSRHDDARLLLCIKHAGLRCPEHFTPWASIRPEIYASGCLASASEQRLYFTL